MKKIEIYTDGSCLTNPGPGGYALLIMEYENNILLKETIYKGGEKKTTNNRMELIGIIQAIEKTLDKKGKITIYSDSKYCVQGYNSWMEGWSGKNWVNSAKKEVLNKDLWQILHNFKFNLKYSGDIKWIKAHSTNKYNNLVDKIAKEEARKFQT